MVLIIYIGEIHYVRTCKRLGHHFCAHFDGKSGPRECLTSVDVDSNLL